MTIRFGILGCASIARRMFAPAIAQVEEAKLVAIASRDASRAAQFASEFGCAAEDDYAALLIRSDIDAVYLPLPPALHETWARKALAAGKHVLSEKPLTTNLAATARLVEEARQADKILGENWMFLHHRQLQFIKDTLASGRLGEIRLLRASFGFPSLPPDNFRYRAGMGGGALLDAGGYTLCIARELLGDPLTLLASHLQTPPTSEVDRFGSALLVSTDGIAAQLAFGFDSHYRCELEIWTANARLTAPRIFTAPPGFAPLIRIETGQGTEEHTIAEDNHFANALRSFIRRINSHDADFDGLLRQAKLTEALKTHAHHTCHQTGPGPA
ncbi:MAG: Gfo/Idh/MocA family oxidoreductase [Dechloromonas sp.]|uniref:Gfo/Idh/MocA family protein n=1 Tax=Azonexus hydrophilus TaxID=418702 RepID=UPI00041C4942|nr:Gfo/Idh/MocA family oxidoreductase [Azonexus hydrophilus]MCA1938782.1 Gfo/Idh/MocA family oxidoreductase [Dechloromonas sp.]